MSYGITLEGFVPKPLDVIVAEHEARVRGIFGQSIPLEPESAFGQLVAANAEREHALWELAEAAYGSRHPDNAEGAALDALCALTGTLRELAAKSTVTLTATGTAGTLLPISRVASVVATGIKFTTLAAVTLAAVTARASSTAYVVGDRRSSGGNTYLCTIAGTSSAGAGPTGTGSAIVDGTVTWRYLGTGTAAADVAAEAQLTGPKVALSGTLTTIETPVGGWSSVTNILDAELGTDKEEDPDLRVRREDELAAAGGGTVDAIRTDVLDVEDVTSCFVFENTTDATDADGVPPKAVETLVRGGADADIRQAIFASGVSCGILAHGTTSGTVVDSQGFNHTVKFTRPTEVPIYVRVDVVKDPIYFPSDGDTQIKEAIVAYGDALAIGNDVVSAALLAQCFKIPGVVNVSLCYISTAPVPTLATTIAITSRQLATFDTSRVTTNLTNGTL